MRLLNRGGRFGRETRFGAPIVADFITDGGAARRIRLQEQVMGGTAGLEQNRWWVLALAGALLTPVFAILWLGVTLTSEPGSLSAAMVKIVFTIVAVGTAALGAKWRTTSGAALVVEALVVVAWMLMKAESYTPDGLLRTSLLLAAPLFISGVLYILAGGMEAGTWPPGRFKRGV